MKKNAFISGASRGIGAETARVLARDGWRVIVGYRSSKNDAEAVAREIGGECAQVDVSDHRSAEALFGQIGAVDLLVNNAGTAYYGLLADMEPAEWDRVINTNLRGMYNCCRAAIPAMVRQKSGGIISISSIWGVAGASCEAAYSASKAGVIGLTRSLAKELGPSGIRVNCVAPGVIETDMLNGLGPGDLRALTDDTPLGRLGTPADVAEAVAFLASDRSGFITGQIITVDGGFLL